MKKRYGNRQKKLLFILAVSLRLFFDMLLPSPEWLNSGNNAWQLAAATFVGLQSIPGLTIIYGGIVKKKWAINSAFMSMYAFSAVLLVAFCKRLNHAVLVKGTIL